MNIRASVAFFASLAISVFIICFVLFPLALIRSLRGGSPTAITRLIIMCGDRLFRIVCVIMRIKPTFRLPDGACVPPCIVIANHQSTMDALVILSLLKRVELLDTRLIGKQEARHFPVVGYLLRKGGIIFLSRAKDPQDKDRIREGALLAKHDRASIFIFPEGTRFAGKGPITGSPYQRVLPPKRGGFQTIREVLSDYPVLTATIRWESSAEKEAQGRTLFELASYYGKTVSIDARLAPAAEVNADPQWLDHEWERKDAFLLNISYQTSHSDPDSCRGEGSLR